MWYALALSVALASGLAWLKWLHPAALNKRGHLAGGMRRERFRAGAPDPVAETRSRNRKPAFGRR
jgi:hypothetical protein